MNRVLLLGDSQVERVWANVRGNREILRDAIFCPVKNRKSMLPGLQSVKPSVNWGFVYILLEIDG